MRAGLAFSLLLFLSWFFFWASHATRTQPLLRQGDLHFATDCYVYDANGLRARVTAGSAAREYNGGFEQGLQNWTASGLGTVTAVNNPANAHSRSYYAEISTPAHTTTTLTTTVPISAQKGETISMTGWVYIETLPPGGAYCRYHLHVAGTNGGIDYNPPDNFTTNTWFNEGTRGRFRRGYRGLTLSLSTPR